MYVCVDILLLHLKLSETWSRTWKESVNLWKPDPPLLLLVRTLSRNHLKADAVIINVDIIVHKYRILHIGTLYAKDLKQVSVSAPYV